MGVSGWNANDSILGFTCVVMPRNELKLSTEDGENSINFPLLILMDSTSETCNSG